MNHETRDGDKLKRQPRRAALPQALLLLLVDSVPMFEGLGEGAEEYFLDRIGQAPSTVGPATLSQTISV